MTDAELDFLWTWVESVSSTDRALVVAETWEAVVRGRQAQQGSATDAP